MNLGLRDVKMPWALEALLSSSFYHQSGNFVCSLLMSLTPFLYWISSGERRKHETTELTAASHLAFTEEAPFKEQVTQAAPRDSRLGQARDQEKLSEMQEGNLRPGTDPDEETCPRKLNRKHDLETDDSLCLRVLQERVTTRDALHEHDSQGPRKDPVIDARNNLYKCKECGKG